jgi:predicted RNase H-like HicB family nuclease
MGYIMAHAFTAVVKRSGEWWIGWIQEIPGVNCQEATKEELLETLKVTLTEILEINRDMSRREAGSDYEEYPIAV